MEIYDVVYIKRHKGEGREIENEGSLIELIKKYSKRPIVLSTESHCWKDQIEIIKGAKVIISSHGAQITSSIFSEDLKLIVEIWPNKLLQPRGLSECFCDNYRWIKSEYLNKKNSGHFSAHMLSKDNLKEIERELSAM